MKDLGYGVEMTGKVAFYSLRYTLPALLLSANFPN